MLRNITRLETHVAEVILVGRLAHALNLSLAQLESIAVGDRVGHTMDQRIGRAARVQEIGEESGPGAPRR